MFELTQEYMEQLVIDMETFISSPTIANWKILTSRMRIASKCPFSIAIDNCCPPGWPRSACRACGFDAPSSIDPWLDVETGCNYPRDDNSKAEVIHLFIQFIALYKILIKGD